MTKHFDKNLKAPKGFRHYGQLQCNSLGQNYHDCVSVCLYIMYYAHIYIYRLYAYLYKHIYLLLLFLFFIITYRQNDRIVTIKKPSAIGNMERYDVGPVLVCVSYPTQPTTKTDVTFKENFVNQKCIH